MIIYSSTADKFITLHGIYTCEEMEYFDRLEREWKDSLSNYSFNELMQIFPESKSVAKKYLEEEIVQCRKDLNTAEEIEKECENVIYRKSSKENEEFWRGVAYIFFIKPHREGREEKIKRNGFHLLSLNRKDVPTKGISQSDIERARQYPIDNFIDFKHKVASCIWHNERTGSLHYYKKTNTVYCFGCGKSADVIDVYMKIHGCNFLTAVKALI